MKLPSKSKMLEYVQKNKKFCHYTETEGCEKSASVYEYAKSLSKEAEIERMRPVLLDIWVDSIKTHHFNKLLDFRKYKYTIIDDETFRKESCENYC